MAWGATMAHFLICQNRIRIWYLPPNGTNSETLFLINLAISISIFIFHACHPNLKLIWRGCLFWVSTTSPALCFCGIFFFNSHYNLNWIWDIDLWDCALYILEFRKCWLFLINNNIVIVNCCLTIIIVAYLSVDQKSVFWRNEISY